MRVYQLLLVLISNLVTAISSAGSFKVFNRHLYKHSTSLSISDEGQIENQSGWQMTSKVSMKNSDLIVLRNTSSAKNPEPKAIGVFRKDGAVTKLLIEGAMSAFDNGRVKWNIECEGPKCFATSRKICEFYLDRLKAKTWPEAREALNKCVSISEELPQTVKADYDNIMEEYASSVHKVRDGLAQAIGDFGFSALIEKPQIDPNFSKITGIAKAIEDCESMQYSPTSNFERVSANPSESIK